jgi:hypothetical protein
MNSGAGAGLSGHERRTRVEFRKTDPSVEPNPGNWVTDLAFRLAD